MRENSQKPPRQKQTAQKSHEIYSELISLTSFGTFPDRSDLYQNMVSPLESFIVLLSGQMPAQLWEWLIKESTGDGIHNTILQILPFKL